MIKVLFNALIFKHSTSFHHITFLKHLMEIQDFLCKFRKNGCPKLPLKIAALFQRAENLKNLPK